MGKPYWHYTANEKVEKKINLLFWEHKAGFVFNVWCNFLSILSPKDIFSDICHFKCYLCRNGIGKKSMSRERDQVAFLTWNRLKKRPTATLETWFCCRMSINGLICREEKKEQLGGKTPRSSDERICAICWYDTLKLKSLMCFMAPTPTDCAEISFHTWTSPLLLLCECECVHLCS